MNFISQKSRERASRKEWSLVSNAAEVSRELRTDLFEKIEELKSLSQNFLQLEFWIYMRCICLRFGK